MKDIDYVLAEIAQRAWLQFKDVKSIEFGITDSQARWVHVVSKIREYLEKNAEINR